MAMETELRLTDDVGKIAAADLGRFDTFFFEEETILRASLEALLEQRWSVAQDWANRRTETSDSAHGETRRQAFWLRDDPSRRNVWHLVAAAARLGVAIEAAGATLPTTDGLVNAVDAYVRAGAVVDQAHRHLEQDRQKLMRAELPEFERLRAVLNQMQIVWRDWADAWAKGFNAICRIHGFLPDSALQQRTLFDESVKPLVSGDGITAFLWWMLCGMKWGRSCCSHLESLLRPI